MKYIPLFEEFTDANKIPTAKKEAFLNAVLDFCNVLKPNRTLSWHEFFYYVNGEGYLMSVGSKQSGTSAKDLKPFFTALGISTALSVKANQYCIRINAKDKGLADLLLKMNADPQILKQWMETKKPLSELDAWLHQKRGSIKGNEFGF